MLRLINIDKKDRSRLNHYFTIYPNMKKVDSEGYVAITEEDYIKLKNGQLKIKTGRPIKLGGNNNE